MSIAALPCIVCGRLLDNVEPEAENQPSDGLAFISYGAYGSTVFDPEDWSYIEFNICDDCLKRKARKGLIVTGRSKAPVLINGADFGTVRVERPLVQWSPELPEDGVTPLNLELDEVEQYLDDPRITWRTPRPTILAFVAAEKKRLADMEGTT